MAQTNAVVRCSCFGSDCKAPADGQHKAYCNKATTTQRFINSLQQFEEAIGALYGVLYKEDMLYSEANRAAKDLEEIRDKAIVDWNGDLLEGEQMVIQCIKAASESLDKCDQYLVTGGSSPLCGKCRDRRDSEEARTLAEREL